LAAPEVAAAIERETMRKVGVRLLPFLFILYVFNFIDRSNVALAALQMNRDLKFSSTAFGLGAGILFIGYALFEVPSNYMLARLGARRWIARIMISWGVIATAMMFVRTPMHFYALRFLLGVAEAGFFPGIVFYLSQWFPARRRARAQSRFMIALPVSGIVGGFLGGFLLGFDGRLGLSGWQWVFLVEGLPSILLGITVLWLLTDKPADAHWLDDKQRAWLIDEMAKDAIASGGGHSMSTFHALKLPVVWILAIPYFLMLTAGYGYTFWIPTVIRDTLHTTDTSTALITAMIATVSMTVMLLTAINSDRMQERFFHAASSGLLIAIGFAGAVLLPVPALKIAFLGIVLIGCNTLLAPFWCMPTSLLSGEAAAVGIALINSLGNIGGFVGPYMIGFLKDATGSNSGAFLGLSTFGLLIFVIFAALNYTAFANPSRRIRSLRTVNEPDLLPDLS